MSKYEKLREEYSSSPEFWPDDTVNQQNQPSTFYNDQQIQQSQTSKSDSDQQTTYSQPSHSDRDQRTPINQVTEIRNSQKNKDIETSKADNNQQSQDNQPIKSNNQQQRENNQQTKLDNDQQSPYLYNQASKQDNIQSDENQSLTTHQGATSSQQPHQIYLKERESRKEKGDDQSKQSDDEAVYHHGRLSSEFDVASSLGEVSLPSNLTFSTSDKTDGNEANRSYDETPIKTLKYPKQVFFIVGNEFCERFSFYGMRTILVLYLNQQMGLSDKSATAIFHGFVSFAYFTPILGAILADSLLGRFKTIFYVSIIYALGNISLSLGSIPKEPTSQAALSFCGLALIALGTGGIKPCVSSLGGDQFALPDQERELKQFFSIFYFSINAGSLISTYLTPELRANVHCFGRDSCYPIAFGVPAVLMIMSLIIFLLGAPLYKHVPPEGAVLVRVVKCILTGLVCKVKNICGNGEKKEHFLDYSEDIYDATFIKEVKTVLSILLLFLPLPIFWALYDQQGSRWTFQASRLDGDFGSFVVLPDQMQIINPVLILVFIPIFEFGVYPLLARCGLLTTSLPRMVLGGLLAVGAFLISGFLSLKIESREPVLPSPGTGDLVLFNECPYSVNVSGSWTGEASRFSLLPAEMRRIQAITTGPSEKIYQMNVMSEASGSNQTFQSAVTVYSEQVYSFLITGTPTFSGVESETPVFITKGPPSGDNVGYPWIRIMYSEATKAENYTFALTSPDNTYSMSGNQIWAGFTDTASVYPGSYHLKEKTSDKEAEGSIKLSLGGAYILYVATNSTSKSLDCQLYILTEPNDISILTLIPQYIVITIGEILFSITGLEFSFSQAPNTMKSVMSAAWLLTVSVGDLMDVIVIESITLDKPSTLTFLFAIIMLVDVVIFAIIAHFYKYEDTQKALTISSRQTALIDDIDNELAELY